MLGEMNTKPECELWRNIWSLETRQLEETFYTDTEVAIFLLDFLWFLRILLVWLLIQSLLLISDYFKHVCM